MGNIIRDARIAKGLTQAELAAKIGVSRTTINQLENNKQRNTSLRTIRSIASVLQIDLDKIFGEFFFASNG